MGAPTIPFNYGDIADQAIGGNWDGVGADGPGVTRALMPNGNGYTWWYLNNGFDEYTDYWPFQYGLHVPNSVDRTSAGTWSCCGWSASRPIVIRNGANEWWMGLDFAGNVGALQYSSGGANDYGIPADWDNDPYDDYIIAV